MRSPLPNMRTVDALTGTVTPSKFFRANAEADERLAELDRLRRDNAMLTRQLDALMETDKGELLVRNLELKAENAELHARCAAYSDEVISLRAALDDARRAAKWSAS